MESAEQCYRRLQSDRDHYLDRARVAARLTIPYLIPETNEPTANHKESYAVPWNGIGARGCLNLASRMLLALLPPTQQFFRFSLDEAELAKQGVPPDQKSQVEEALSKVERLVLREIEASNDRVVFHEALLHLIVGGNALLYVSTEGLRVFHLNRYVCSRDPMGNPLKVVTCEELELGQLPKNVQEICYQEEDELQGIVDRDYKPDGKEKTVKLYTYIRWEENTVHWHQEVKGQIVPGTEGRSPKDISPWLPLRMTHVAGAPYGVGYVESAAIADLQTVEALCQAIAEGSLASSKVLFLVKPSGVTKAADLAKAPNGAFVTGDPNDVLALQVQKSTDLGVAMQGKQQIEQRLATAFMLANMRDAERVTAEEVRLQALQTENSLGSIFSILQAEFQVPYVARKLDILTRAGKVPKMDSNLVKPVMTVGLAAVGRGNDVEQLVRFTTTLGQTIGPEGLAQFVKPSELIKRLAYSMGIDVLGLIKTEEELAAEQQQMQQMQMAQQAMQAGMADPQKLANAASMVQDAAQQTSEDPQ
jgi:hypothetical protein|tara:strand:+ start:1940 stop:3538 length:1599 start_codon:yes stop_codon:yes gene_type:complete